MPGPHASVSLSANLKQQHPTPTTPRSLSIVSVALGLGYGIGANNGILAHAPQMISLVFGGSGIVPAALVAILLNLASPKDENG